MQEALFMAVLVHAAFQNFKLERRCNVVFVVQSSILFILNKLLRLDLELLRKAR